MALANWLKPDTQESHTDEGKLLACIPEQKSTDVLIASDSSPRNFPRRDKSSHASAPNSQTVSADHIPTTIDGTIRRTPVLTNNDLLPPTPLMCDNKGTTFTAKNPFTSARSRHLDSRWFCIRDYIKDRVLRVSHIPTDKNVADIFTKALDKPKFLALRRYLMGS